MSVFGHLKTVLHRMADNQTGASLVEYALLVSLIAIVAVAAVAAFGGALATEYSGIADTLP